MAKATSFLNRFKSLGLRTGLTVSILASFPSIALADILYTGVSAGDATSNSAVLWTRATDTVTPTQVTSLTLQIATDSVFTNIVKVVNGVTDASKDYTWKSEVTGLSSGTQYYYRFVSGAFQSSVGKFKTAPARNQSVAVTFGFSGDADGQWRPYSSTQNFANLNLDFFVFLGDTIYETASGSSGNNLSAATTLTDATTLTPSIILSDYHRKYREQFAPVNTNGFSGLKTLFASQGNYTLLDNHELGNKQYINGGAPVGTLPGPGADATNTTNDVNTTGVFINKTDGFKALLQAYKNYQPLRERTISAPSDPRSDGTQGLYYAQQWGAKLIFINLDDRSYRDIRLKTGTVDETGSRAANPSRTMLGATQLAWLERTLSLAQTNGVTWKFIAVSSPIDEIGPTTAASIKALSTGDGGKSWIGGYRVERNTLLKYIADNNIKNVVFLSTDDHLNRINELTYLNDTNDVSSNGGRTLVSNAFTIVAGPLGAGGPDLITNHTFSYIKGLADTLANAQTGIGVNPIGLASTFPGLQIAQSYREGDATASTSPQPVDFFSPDTFNYVTFNISADGQLLTVNTYGINSYSQNTFPEPDTINNPVRNILRFQIQAQ